MSEARQQAALATIKALSARYGVKTLSEAPAVDQRLRPLAADEVRLDLPGDVSLSECWGAYVEVGQPGTRTIAGRLAVEPNPEMTPYAARGSYGNTGIFDELLREPGVYSAVSTLTNLIKGGEFDLEYPKALSRQTGFAEIERAADELWGRLQDIEGGWDQLIQDLCSAILKGFAIFEIVYGVDPSSRMYPRKLAFREQSTVGRWVLDARGRKLLAVTFDTTGDRASSYTLPAWGERQEWHKVLLASVGRVGNNFEGISPARTLRMLVDFKHLLIAIAAASTERFGCPALLVEPHAATYDNNRQMWSQEDMDAVYTILAAMQALDTPTLTMPTGLTARYLSPEGNAVDVVGLLNYCDQQIAQVFATQAQQLGHSTASGSYALAQVQDGDLQRAAPAYARTLLMGINQLFRQLLRDQWHVKSLYLPRIVWSPTVGFDTSRWLEDLERLATIAPSLPQQVLREACERMGLSPDAFDGGQ